MTVIGHELIKWYTNGKLAKRKLLTHIRPLMDTSGVVELINCNSNSTNHSLLV